MRIGIDALLLGPSDSGVEIYIRNLVRALACRDTGNEYLIYLTRDAAPPDTAGNPRFQLRRTAFRSGSRTRRILYEQGRFRRDIACDGVKVLHSPGYVMPLFCSTPTVVTMHDLIALKFPRLCKPSNVAHYRLLLPHAARRAHRIIASSHATKGDLVSLLKTPREKIEVIHPGVDEIFLAPPAGEGEVRKRYALPEKYILFVGNIEPKKNLPALVEACHLLQERHGIRLPLLIVGKRGWKCGPLFHAIRSIGLNRQVLFRGYADRRDLPALYRMAEVFVFPSLVEGFGLPPLEAMASGTPVVASSAPALPEAVGDAAVMVPPDSPRLLAVAVAKVLQNSFLRKALIERGRERVKLFSWADVAERMIGIYNELAAPEKA